MVKNPEETKKKKNLLRRGRRRRRRYAVGTDRREGERGRLLDLWRVARNLRLYEIMMDHVNVRPRICCLY